uniref:Uncharacterized protein n=1 Tax=Plectus sambesii TaxID=2011161 RepID=A0A914VDU2_9BILA
MQYDEAEAVATPLRVPPHGSRNARAATNNPETLLTTLDAYLIAQSNPFAAAWVGVQQRTARQPLVAARAHRLPPRPPPPPPSKQVGWLDLKRGGFAHGPTRTTVTAEHSGRTRRSTPWPAATRIKHAAVAAVHNGDNLARTNSSSVVEAAFYEAAFYSQARDAAALPKTKKLDGRHHDDNATRPIVCSSGALTDSRGRAEAERSRGEASEVAFA